MKKKKKNETTNVDICDSPVLEAAPFPLTVKLASVASFAWDCATEHHVENITARKMSVGNLRGQNGSFFYSFEEAVVIVP